MYAMLSALNLTVMHILSLNYHFKVEIFLVWLDLYNIYVYHYGVSLSTFCLFYKEHFQSALMMSIYNLHENHTLHF